MTKKLLFSLLMFLIILQIVSLNVYGQEVEITFCLYSPDLHEDSIVYITGSDSALGNWNPGKVKMKSVGDNIWEHSITCQSREIIEYKYTLGSWRHEAANDSGFPLPNFSIKAVKDTIIKNKILKWTKDRNMNVEGQITGTVKYHRQLNSDGIMPRDVIVWLPPNYDKSDKRYPVLYMHDGQNIIDPQTSAFGVDWEIDETCTQLIAEKMIPPLIVVGIYNAEERAQEYVPGIKGTAYKKFIVEVLKPFIDKNYRTNSSRENTFIGGSSAGGLCAFMLAWEYPEVFSKAMCMSPALKYENVQGTIDVDYVRTVKESERPDEPLFFYMDVGNDNIEKLIKPGLEEMLIVLQEKGYKANEDFVFIYDENARHFEADWARRFPEAIKLFFPEY
jgi:predicted alpha/beta superfamily hydrolase